MIVNAIINTGDDIDIVELCLRHNLKYFDQILVLDNNSTDGTKEVIDRLIFEYGEKLKLIHINSQTAAQHVVTINFFKEQIKLSENPPDYLFVMDADEFIYADNLSELESIPDGFVGQASWRCYIPNRLDHVNFLKEMSHRRDSEPSGCHKVIIPKETNGFLILGNHYLHQDHKRVPAVELKTIFLAHYPVRSVKQMKKKIDFMTKALSGEDPSQSYHLRNIKYIETLEELVDKATNYADTEGLKYNLVHDPLYKS